MNLRKLHILCTALLIVLIPIYQKGFLSFLVLVLFLLTVSQINKNRKVEWLNIVLAGVGLFGFILLSMFWTDALDIGWKKIETKLSLLLIPLVFGLSPPLKSKDFKRIASASLIGVFISAAVLLVRAGIAYYQTSDPSVFAYSKLSTYFHPSYVSMYYVVGLCVIFFFFEKNKVTNWVRICHHLLAGLLVIMVGLLASKTGIITCLIVLVIAFFKNITCKKQGKYWFHLAVLTLLLISVIMLNPRSRERVSAVVTEKEMPINPIGEDLITSSKKSSTQARLAIWDVSLDIIADNSLLGVGIGDSKNVLLEQYLLNKEYYIHSKKLNAHNQFLETGIALGVIGMAFLVLTFLYLLIKSYRNKDILMCVIVLVILLNLVTESMLETQSGTVFIALIISLLLFRDQGEKTTMKKSISN